MYYSVYDPLPPVLHPPPDLSPTPLQSEITITLTGADFIEGWCTQISGYYIILSLLLNIHKQFKIRHLHKSMHDHPRYFNLHDQWYIEQHQFALTLLVLTLHKSAGHWVECNLMNSYNHKTLTT